MRRKITSLALIALLLAGSLAGCARKGADLTYKKAFYSAHVVYDLDALGDLFEILKDGGVISLPGFKKSIEVTNEGLTAYDEIAELLEKGWPVGNFDKARATVKAFRNAVANGAIKFNSPNAEKVIFDAVATLEVGINLAEAVNAGRKKDVEALEAEHKAKATKLKASIAQAGPTWYQSAIVRASRLATDLTLLSNSEAPQIWEAVKAKSKEAHDKNAVRLK